MWRAIGVQQRSYRRNARRKLKRNQVQKGWKKVTKEKESEQGTEKGREKPEQGREKEKEREKERESMPKAKQRWKARLSNKTIGTSTAGSITNKFGQGLAKLRQGCLIVCLFVVCLRCCTAFRWSNFHPLLTWQAREAAKLAVKKTLGPAASKDEAFWCAIDLDLSLFARACGSETFMEVEKWEKGWKRSEGCRDWSADSIWWKCQLTWLSLSANDSFLGVKNCGPHSNPILWWIITPNTNKKGHRNDC